MSASAKEVRAALPALGHRPRAPVQPAGWSAEWSDDDIIVDIGAP